MHANGAPSWLDPLACAELAEFQMKKGFIKAK
jgi:hypothetical protein